MCIRDSHQHSEQAYPQRQRLLRVLAVMQQIDTKSIAAKAITAGATGLKVGELINKARIAAVQANCQDLQPVLSS